MGGFEFRADNTLEVEMLDPRPALTQLQVAPGHHHPPRSKLLVWYQVTKPLKKRKTL